MLWRAVNVSVAFAFSAAAGAAGGRGAAASSSAVSLNVPLAAVMDTGRRGAFLLVRMAGGRFPSSCVSATSSVMVFCMSSCVCYVL